MKLFFFFLIVCITTTSTFAQYDTIYHNYDKNWNICSADTATFFGKIYKSGDHWGRLDYFKKTGFLQMQGIFLDSLTEKGDGQFVYYYPNGKKYKEALYHWDRYRRLVNETTYYRDGKTRLGFVKMKDFDHVEAEGGWDSLGNVIPHFIYGRNAHFPGGMTGWVEYLQQNLKAEIPANNGAPVGMYSVKLEFEVDSLGDVDHIVVKKDPGYGTSEEAVRIIKNSGKWIPAIQYNRTISCTYNQTVSFQVTEDKEEKKIDANQK